MLNIIATDALTKLGNYDKFIKWGYENGLKMN